MQEDYCNEQVNKCKLRKILVLISSIIAFMLQSMNRTCLNY